jgi:hypothetical protein
VTALAWSWGDPDDIQVMTHYDWPREELASAFAALVTTPNIIVTGHWVTGFDLPLGNGALMRENLPAIRVSLLASDTKTHLVKSAGRSLSQKNLSADLGVSAPKVDVTLRAWEDFNLRVPGNRQKGIDRVTGDVRQHLEMRARLIELGWLGPAQYWNPTTKVSGYGRYRG